MSSGVLVMSTRVSDEVVGGDPPVAPSGTEVFGAKGLDGGEGPGSQLLQRVGHNL